MCQKGLINYALADLGGVPRACPQGSRFFRFDIQNFRKVTVSGVHAPLRIKLTHTPDRKEPFISSAGHEGSTFLMNVNYFLNMNVHRNALFFMALFKL